MSKTIVWLVLIAVSLGGAIGLYFWLGSGTPPPEVAQAPGPPEEPAIHHPIEEAPLGKGSGMELDEPLPALADSDKAMRDEMAKLVGRNLEKFFNLQDIIHRVVATVDNLPLEHAPPQLMPTKPVPKDLVTTGEGENLRISPKNSARYRPYVQLAESLPTASLVAVYARFYPLFQQQYEKLGYPGKYFNDRLVQVIDHLLAAPEVTGPVLLTQTNVRYKFADPDLEALSAGRKILIRMGDENAARVKAKLQEIRSALVVKPPEK